MMARSVRRPNFVRQRCIFVERDNARVNRADEKYKLVKMESDTMGACDHPATSQPQRKSPLRLNALLYSDRVIRPATIRD